MPRGSMMFAPRIQIQSAAVICSNEAISASVIPGTNAAEIACSLWIRPRHCRYAVRRLDMHEWYRRAGPITVDERGDTAGGTIRQQFSRAARNESGRRCSDKDRHTRASSPSTIKCQYWDSQVRGRQRLARAH